MGAYSFVKGSDVTITVQVKDKDTKVPYALTGFTSATLFIKKDDNTYLSATGTLVSSDLGKLSFTINETDSDTLRAGTKLDIQLTVNQGSTKTNFLINEMLSIYENLA
jgi:hypothetical protein